MSNCKKAHQSLPYQTVKRHNDIYRVKPQENNNVYRVKPQKNTTISTGYCCGLFLRFDTVEIGVLFYGLTR
jgi:hypothetical protein